VHGGWERRQALLFNLLSALTFLVGGLLAYGASLSLDVSFLLPFAAGNFIYIAASDLIPEVKEDRDWRMNLIHFASGWRRLLFRHWLHLLTAADLRVGHARRTRARGLIYESSSAFLARIPISSFPRHTSLLFWGPSRPLRHTRTLAGSDETTLKFR
jgi:hypothetical protein